MGLQYYNGHEPPGTQNHDPMFIRFAAYGFLKNLRFFEPFLILIFRAAGLSYLEIGLLYSIRSFTAQILEIPTGVFADAVGRRRTMVLAFTSYIVSFLLLFVSSGFQLMAVGMVLFGLGEAMRSGTHKALILQYLALNGREKEALSYYGRTRAASQLGSAMNAIVAAGLVWFTGSYRAMFAAATVPYVLDLVNLASYPRELDGISGHHTSESIWSRLASTIRATWAQLKEGTAFKVINSSAMFSGVFETSKDYLQPLIRDLALGLPLFLYLDDQKRTSALIGIVFAALYFMTSMASRNSVTIAKWQGGKSRAANRLYLIGSFILVAAGMIWHFDLLILASLLLIVLYLIQNARKPMMVAIISEALENRVMASGLSIEAQLKSIYVVILAPLVGYAADVWGIGVAVAMLGVLLSVFIWLARVEPSTLEHKV
ncbi:MAG: MFS transporter [Chloroflexota bacterium]